MNEIATFIAIGSTVVCVTCLELLLIVWLVVELQARLHYLKMQRERQEQENYFVHARHVHPVRRATR